MQDSGTGQAGPSSGGGRRDARGPRVAVLSALVAFAYPAVVTVVAFLPLVGPDPLPADAPPERFSAGRAMEPLRVIAAQPRPAMSPANERVREYLVQRLREIGWETTTQEGTRKRIELTNVVARKRGTGSTGAVLLACHHDSVPEGPGAADDGVAVAAFLETARALNSGPRLRNDVMLLFTDGEELHLLGADLFTEHPWFRDVGVVFNFEARGISGPSIMFETSDGNGALIREFARAVSYPVGTSLAYSVYELLPNDTDMTVFRAHGVAGLNFAFINGVTAYHTAADSIDAVSGRSVQHHGDNALELARHFGEVDVRDLESRDAVYFNVHGRVFVHYSGRWVLPILALDAVVVALVCLAALRTGLRSWGIVTGAWSFAVVLLESGLLVVGAWVVPWAVTRVLGSLGSPPRGDIASNDLLVVGKALLGLAILSWRVRIRLRRTDGVTLFIGALVVWLLLLAVTSVLLPGASYLLAWPLLAAALGAGVALLVWRDDPMAPGTAVVTAACAFPGWFLLGQTAYLMFLALFPMPAVAVFVTTLLIALAGGLMLPCSVRIAQSGRRAVVTAGAVGVVLMVAGFVLQVGGW